MICGDYIKSKIESGEAPTFTHNDMDVVMYQLYSWLKHTLVAWPLRSSTAIRASSAAQACRANKKDQVRTTTGTGPSKSSKHGGA